MPITPLRRRLRKCDLIVLVLLAAAYFAVMLPTLTDYGPGWDTWELYTGDRNLAFYMTLNPEYLAYDKPLPMPNYGSRSHPNFLSTCQNIVFSSPLNEPYQTWPLGATSAALSKYLFYTKLGLTDLFTASHAAAVIWGAALLAIVWRWGAKRLGRRAALVAVLLLWLHPRLFAHLHNNFKDLPILTLFTLTVMVSVEAVKRRRAGLLAFAGVIWGLALAAKANAWLAPIVIGPWFLLVLWRRRRANAPVFSGREALALAAAPVLAAMTAIACWPWLWVDLPTRLAQHFKYVFNWGLQQEHSGWQLAPMRNLLSTAPPALLVLATVGLFAIVLETWRQRRLRALHLLLLTWLLVPALRVSMPRAHDFDVIRHWLEVLVPLTMLAGIGAQTLAHVSQRMLVTCGDTHWLRSKRLLTLQTMMLGFLLIPTIAWLVRSHPNQLVYYNAFTGGLPGARSRGWTDATDYWGQSYHQGLAWINANAEPDAMLMVGLAEHIVAFSAPIWLREDAKLYLYEAHHPSDVVRTFSSHPSSVYLMYITRNQRYSGLVRIADARLQPEHEIRVDGAPILKIQRLKPADGPICFQPHPADQQALEGR